MHQAGGASRTTECTAPEASIPGPHEQQQARRHAQAARARAPSPDRSDEAPERLEASEPVAKPCAPGEVPCAGCAVAVPQSEAFVDERGALCVSCHQEAELARREAPSPLTLAGRALVVSVQPALVSFFVLGLLRYVQSAGWDGRLATEMVLILSASLGAFAMVMLVSGLGDLRQQRSGWAGQESAGERGVQVLGASWWVLNGLASLAMLAWVMVSVFL